MAKAANHRRQGNAADQLRQRQHRLDTILLVLRIVITVPIVPLDVATRQASRIIGFGFVSQPQSGQRCICPTPQSQ